MARGVVTRVERLELVAQLARELPAAGYDARAVADFARWLIRSQASLQIIRDRVWNGTAGDADLARRKRIMDRLEAQAENTGIRAEANPTTYQIRLRLPSGAGNCNERGIWEVR